MTTITGKNNISAKIIADSTSKFGTRMTTFELEYPRFIHSELMTHRMLSKNAASSRAIPIQRMHDVIIEKPASPVFWGKNQAGMQANEEIQHVMAAKDRWNAAAKEVVKIAQDLAELGLHKQIVNRVTEPFQLMKTVISGTEWSNFLWLRNHEDAQPEFKELAQCVENAMITNVPMRLEAGEWHVPYIRLERNRVGGKLRYFVGDDVELTMEQARMVSASCCAQVSYRKNDDSLEKALQIFDRLINSQPIHASPVEHQATPMQDLRNDSKYNWEDGMTHVDRNGNRWSGNIREWVQFRKLIPNEAKW
jgi:hypothetical protein